MILLTYSDVTLAFDIDPHDNDPSVLHINIMVAGDM